jgi:predicted RNase H-like HicB family nuclease
MKVRDVIKQLERDGWRLDRTSGVEASGDQEMKKYLIVIEKTGTGYSAYSPDLDGCVATGKTRDEVEREMQEAIAFHLKSMAQSGQPIPEPQTHSRYVEVSAPNR